MPSLKEIQTRITSLKTTEKITTAMKLISITKYRRLSHQFVSIDTFIKKFKDTTKYIKPIPQGNQKYLIVFAPERGLCASLNTKFNRFIKNYEGYNIISIGKIRHHEEVSILKTPKESPLQFLKTMMNSIVDYNEIKLIYAHFHSSTKQQIQEIKIFPWTYEEENNTIKELENFDIWFKDYLSLSLYHAFFHSQISEYAARMVAMDTASKNAKDLIQELKLSYNKQRQASITKEIMETGVSVYGE